MSPREKLSNGQVTIHDLTQEWVTQRLAELETIKRMAGRSARAPGLTPVERIALFNVEHQAAEGILAVAGMFAAYNPASFNEIATALDEPESGTTTKIGLGP